MPRLLLPLLALAVLALPACDLFDDGDDGRTDAELIVGAWDATTASVLVDIGPTNVPVPVSDLAASGDDHTFDFEADGTFSFVFDPVDDRRLTITYQGTTYVDIPLPDGPVTLTGTYELDEDADELHFSTVPNQTVDDFHLAYDFNSSGSRLSLEAEDPQTLARLFGLAGGDYEAFAQYVVGGSLSYSKLL